MISYLTLRKYAPIWALKILTNSRGYSLEKAKEIDPFFAQLVAALMKEILEPIKRQQELKQSLAYKQQRIVKEALNEQIALVKTILSEQQKIIAALKKTEFNAFKEIVKQATDGTINEAEIYDLKKMIDETWEAFTDQPWLMEEQIDILKTADPWAKKQLRSLRKARATIEKRQAAELEAINLQTTLARLKKENNLDD